MPFAQRVLAREKQKQILRCAQDDKFKRMKFKNQADNSSNRMTSRV
jgi:hypothetical protein